MRCVGVWDQASGSELVLDVTSSSSAVAGGSGGRRGGRGGWFGQVARKAVGDSEEDMRRVPVQRHLRDVDLIEWDTGGDCHLDGLPVISGR